MQIERISIDSVFDEDKGDEFSLIHRFIPKNHIPQSYLPLVFKVSQATDRKTLYAESAEALYAFCKNLSSVVVTLRDEDGNYVLRSHYNGGVWDPYHVGCVSPGNILALLTNVRKLPIIRRVDPATFEVGWWYREPFYCIIPIFGPDDEDVIGTLALGYKDDPDDIEDVVSFGQLVSSAISLALQRETSLDDAIKLGQRLEREYLFQSVHDSAIQDVYAAEMALVNVLESCRDKQLCATIEYAASCMSRANTSLRRLLAEDHNNRVEASEGLSAIVQDELERHTMCGGVQAETMVGDTGKLSQPLSYAFKMILREALCNVRKHSQAMHVVVMGSERDGTVMLTIQDDGVGFDNGEAHPDGQFHFGLSNLRKVAEDLGGSFSIESHPGEGCAVRARIPLILGGEPR